ncbi:MAG: adenylyltransferase/cytidyltransferase family protein [Spirochaetales bacterium]|nr:adenylyltransferase/cytidyltransferase family protein [Spirochaetales bacterium]
MNLDRLQAKIFPDANSFREGLSRLKRPLVFTNGCFDILHSGHVELFCRARDLGETLVVGLNSDDSVRGLKGPERPLNRWFERSRVIAALFAVDYVLGFAEATPEALIRLIRPDVHVKGGDYRPDDLPEREAVLSGGGRIEIVPLLGGFSTTGLIERMRNG